MAIKSIIEDLMNPDAFPDKTETVSVVQTHISMVFVADSFVYKIKKAVNFGFLDFSTLEKRFHYCHEEINLNRRLAKNIYLDVLPVVFDGKRYRIGEGRGDIVDYAVKMRRISDKMIMKSLFERRELDNKHLEDIAVILNQFHKTSDHSPRIDEFGKPNVFRINTDENFAQTEKYIGTTISRQDFHAIRQWTNDYYKNEELFFKRIRNEKIRDCHGDLHMEHISLEDPIAIFDCIEFNERFRFTDTIADIAFLLMDLEYRGGKHFADTFWKFYTEKTGDHHMSSLLRFYKVYRAYVRGKVNSFQLDDKGISSREKREAIQAAKRYFQLARSYIDG
jgi:aminoglycoside phosphotransferase family enzyme